ncbi:MAG TPA: isocitrate lyase/PEP mutase family protein, partial [Burkholderiales bacterium]|nr:isocitrate lyase/PEP mutase family protein [Burkholderiales bacterium]
MKAPSIRQLAKSEKPLVLPGAHDALSALLIKQAGFKGFFIGGFQTAGARYGLPDIDLAQLGEFSAAFRDMIGACDLPVLVDADNGYGDVKNCVHLLHTYERMGVSALFIEDQVSPKRCGHMAGKRVVPAAEMEAKLRAMAAERLDPETFIVARTDARALHGMDEALRRAERYVRAGADGVFIESMLNEGEIARAVR